MINAETSPTIPPTITDTFGRTLRYLRVSVTDVCNLSCHYCNPVQGCASLHPHKLSWDDLDYLVDLAINELGIESIRITGGEPTVRPGLLDWLKGLKRHNTLKDLAMTTNGIRLKELAKPLWAAGIKRMNVSLDTFKEEKFREITRGGDIRRVLSGLRAAKETFNRVKLNAVLLKDFNIEEIKDFINFSHQEKIEVRFIELMPIWNQKEYFHQNYISVDDVKQIIAKMGYQLLSEGDGPSAGNRTGYGPATTYQVVNSDARIGFISQMSSTKCLSCNKLRLTSDGSLKPCLLSPNEINLVDEIKDRNSDTIIRFMKREFLSRAERFDITDAMTAPFERSMQAIGG